MSADDDTELRDLVIDSLEKKGVLGRIKAELRATVFLALEENEKDQVDGNSQLRGRSQQELSKFLSTDEGMMSLSLVRDFLQQFNLDFSLAVLDPEVSSSRKCIPRNELGSMLKLCPDKETCCPLLGMLLLKNQSNVYDNDNCDKNGNAQVKVCSDPEYDTEKKSLVNNEFLKGSSFGKSQNETNLNNNQGILSGPKSDDSFFDDPLPVAKNNSLFSNYLTKPPAAKASLDTPPLALPVTEKPKESKNMSSSNMFGAAEAVFPDAEIKKGGAFGLASLKDLPSLVGGSSKPKEGRRQWKDTDPEQRERFMNLTFGSSVGLSDSFPSPTRSRSSASGKDEEEEAAAEPERSDPLEQEASIEENIEEDLSALADELISSTSSKDENVTVDKSVSSFSKAGDFDYMENLT